MSREETAVDVTGDVLKLLDGSFVLPGDLLAVSIRDAAGGRP